MANFGLTGSYSRVFTVLVNFLDSSIFIAYLLFFLFNIINYQIRFNALNYI